MVVEARFIHSVVDEGRFYRSSDEAPIKLNGDFIVPLISIRNIKNFYFELACGGNDAEERGGAPLNSDPFIIGFTGNREGAFHFN